MTTTTAKKNILTSDIKQVVFSFLSLQEACKIPGIDIKTYCKYTRIEEIMSMAEASRDGHLEVVKYLHDLGSECTQRDLENARYYGDECRNKMAIYLHSKGLESSELSMDLASENGRLEVVKYLHGIGAKCTNSAINKAHKKGHMEVVKFLQIEFTIVKNLFGYN
jgi:hypothetical protein